MRKAPLILIVFLLLLVSSSAVLAQSSESDNYANSSLTPIDHIVIIMQENHSFDNYFGTFPGLAVNYKENPKVCMPISSSSCMKPFNADGESTYANGVELYHSWNPSHGAYNGGAMN